MEAVSNYDKGFTRDEAEYIVQDMRRRDNIKEARMVAMGEGSCDYVR